MHPSTAECRILHLAYLALNIVAELAKGYNPLHFLWLNFETKVLLHDNNNINEVKAINTKIIL